MTSYPDPGERPEGIGGGAEDIRHTTSTEDVTGGEGLLPSSIEEMSGSNEQAAEAATATASYQPSGSPSSGSPSSGSPLSGWAAGSVSDSGSKTDVAKSEAKDVTDAAVGAGSNVAGTARQEAGNIAQEVSGQARGLLDQLRSDVRDQGTGQKDRIASTLHSLSSELGSMASNSEEEGPVTDLAHQASRRGGEIADWLADHEPGDVLEEVKRYARRRPFTFLAICAAAGIVVGRLTRGAVAANTSLDSADSSSVNRALPAGTDSGAGTAAASQGPNVASTESYPAVAEPSAAGLETPAYSGPGASYDTGSRVAPSEAPGRGQAEYRP